VRTPANTDGPCGRKTRCVSHLFAVHQACSHANTVIAILPQSAIADLREKPPILPLARTWHIHHKAFSPEGAEVSTVALVFGHGLGQEPACPIEAASPLPSVPRIPSGHFSIENRKRTDYARILLPHTGSTKARVYLHRRDIRIGFECGTRQREVMLGLLGKHLYDLYKPADFPLGIPRSIRYANQGWMDSQAFVASGDHQAHFKALSTQILGFGPGTSIDPMVERSLARQARRHAIESLPFPQRIHVPRVANTGIVNKPIVCGTGFGAPTIPKGATVEIAPDKPGYLKVLWAQNKRSTVLSIEEAGKRIIGTTPSDGKEWKEIGVRIRDVRPDLWEHAGRRIEAAGADKVCSWDFQREDLQELDARNANAIVDWDMGLGKTRLWIALCMLGGKHNLAVIPAHLEEEALREIRRTGQSDNTTFIRSPSDLKNLRKINIITYSRLRMPIDGHMHRRDSGHEEPFLTLSHLMRRRFHTIVADEAQLLSNRTSEQTKAVWRLGGRRRFALTGTPVNNYVRNMTSLMTWVAGDGTARQPFGFDRPMMTPSLISDTSRAQRGQDVFRERHISMEWVTHTFSEDLTTGAKREVPRVRNVDQLRQVIAPMLLRRRVDEPMVRAHFSVPVPKITTSTMSWDRDHFLHYYKVCSEFRSWYRERSDTNNLTMILARMAAVQNAANAPFADGLGTGYTGRSTKMDAIIATAAQWKANGDRGLIITRRPAVADHIGAGLQALGISHVMYHGGIPIRQRNRDLYKHFVDGDATAMVGTIASCQTGLNLWMANKVLITEHDWTARAEDQVIRRVLRPQQKREVEVTFLELDGSIDEYQGQMTKQKRACSDLLIDHQGEEGDQEEFVHIDAILHKFVKDFEAVEGVKVSELTKNMKFPRPYIAI
jgi:superfamily II DNA or RNA helicase